MENLSTIPIIYLLTFVIAIPTARSFDNRPGAVQSWFESRPNMKEKLVRIHFYAHLFINGENQTQFAVAEAKNTATSPTQFGLMNMVDYQARVGPEPDSKIIGRFQGTTAWSSFEEVSELVTVNILFTEGEYRGSTLGIFGREPTSDEYREMSFVGGTGVFSLARGICTTKTIGFTGNPNNGQLVVEFTGMVLYYDDNHGV